MKMLKFKMLYILCIMVNTKLAVTTPEVSNTIYPSPNIYSNTSLSNRNIPSERSFIESNQISIISSIHNPSNHNNLSTHFEPSNHNNLYTHFKPSNHNIPSNYFASSNHNEYLLMLPSFYINLIIDNDKYTLSLDDFVYGMNHYNLFYLKSRLMYLISSKRLDDIRYQLEANDMKHYIDINDRKLLYLKYSYAVMIHKKSIDISKKQFSLKYSKNYVAQFIKDNLHTYNKESKNSQIYVEDMNGSIWISEEQMGRSINKKKIMENVDKYLSDWSFKNIDITVNSTVIVPNITKKELEECRDILGSATSVYNSGSNKYHNIKNGVNKLQGIVIAPNEMISINKILSPYTQDNGYISSSVFTKEEILYGVGGGVCQLTSTIYESLLKAELTILERHPHNYVVSYSKPTLDATVSTHGLDLRFQNNTKNLIFIVITLTEDELAVKIYGKEYRNSNRTIDLRVVIEKNYLPSSGRQGCTATLYKDVYWKNKKIEERYIYQEHYMEYEESL